MELLIRCLASLKYFLIGWVCIGAYEDKVCVRMASEVIFPNYEQCNEYYRVAMKDLVATEGLSNVKEVTYKFDCAQAGVLEDIL